MSAPTIIGLLVTSIYNLADTYFVSQLGTNATGAVGINASLDQVIMMAGSFLGIGATSYISRLLGARKKEEAESVVSTVFLASIVIGVLVMVFGFIFMRPMVRLMGAIDEIEQYSMDYASYVLFAAPFLAASYVLNHSLKAEGSAMLSLFGMAAGAVLNIILDPIFIFTLDMGVKGASIATAISKFVSFVILLAPYVLKKTSLRPSYKKVKFSRDTVVEVGKMGSSSLARTLLAILAGVMLNRIAGGYSGATIAAIAVVNRISFMVGTLCLGLGQGCRPIIGFCYGAKHYDRLLKVYRFALLSAIGVITVVAAALIIFSNGIIGLFNSEADAELLRLGSLCLRSQSLMLPFVAVMMITNSMYSGCGKAVGSLVLSICRQGICFIPMVYLLPRLFAESGVAVVQAASDALSFVVTLAMSVHIVRQIVSIKKSQCAGAESYETNLEAISDEA